MSQSSRLEDETAPVRRRTSQDDRCHYQCSMLTSHPARKHHSYVALLDCPSNCVTVVYSQLLPNGINRPEVCRQVRRQPSDSLDERLKHSAIQYVHNVHSDRCLTNAVLLKLRASVTVSLTKLTTAACALFGLHCRVKVKAVVVCE